MLEEMKPATRPVALTIAGSDSGGGAGIQADLKTFAAFGVHGCSAITCVTAQNPREVRMVQAIKPTVVREQLEAVFAELSPAAVKTGMLYSAPIIRLVAEFFGSRTGALPPLIVDPVMLATSGARLLKPAAVRSLIEDLLPHASLVTPNLDEATILAGIEIKSIEDCRTAAKTICRRFGCPALVKGGHLRGGADAIDIFFDGENELLLSAERVKGVSTHGTGCTYSAAIAGYVTLECPLPYAVELAKNHITQAIAQSYRAGKHGHLNPLWED